MIKLVYVHDTVIVDLCVVVGAHHESHAYQFHDLLRSKLPQ